LFQPQEQTIYLCTTRSQNDNVRYVTTFMWINWKHVFAKPPSHGICETHAAENERESIAQCLLADNGKPLMQNQHKPYSDPYSRVRLSLDHMNRKVVYHTMPSEYVIQPTEGSAIKAATTPSPLR